VGCRGDLLLGLTLTSQAIVTPDLASDFPDPIFLLFWAMHLLVVWAAVYLVWGSASGRRGAATASRWPSRPSGR
jgi:uncharacterized membrane protein YwaF